MKLIAFAALPVFCVATPALAGGGAIPQLPGSGTLGLVAAAVVGGIFLARRRR